MMAFTPVFSGEKIVAPTGTVCRLQIIRAGISESTPCADDKPIIGS